MGENEATMTGRPTLKSTCPRYKWGGSPFFFLLEANASAYHPRKNRAKWHPQLLLLSLHSCCYLTFYCWLLSLRFREPTMAEVKQLQVPSDLRSLWWKGSHGHSTRTAAPRSSPSSGSTSRRSSRTTSARRLGCSVSTSTTASYR